MAVIVAATWLAVDDTDSPEGMCTTYLARLLLGDLSDYDLLGLPRLVRLNPNIPWKTRGNAAVCIPLGKGRGRRHLCGSIGGSPLYYYEAGTALDPREVLSRAAKVLESNARFECDMTNPGLVATIKKPPASLYWRAVRTIVPLQDVEQMLSACDASWLKYKNGRGVIGASSAVSWRPRDRTWEVIAYRFPVKFGTERRIDPKSVIAMDKATRYTFNNYDYENGHVAITPASPCPILFGIRGDSSSELLRARALIRGERQESWILYLTNQATEEHVVAKRIRDFRPGDSVRSRAVVLEPARAIRGGHILLKIGDGAEIDAAFYEPSRGFRDVARSMIPGDEAVLIGSVRDSPRSLNVEKLRVVRLAREVRKVHNPVCKKCGKSMGSLGSGQGFRCKKCGAKAPYKAARFRVLERQIAPGWYEPPVASRRHLHKPIRRMSRVDINKI
jgi:tRNA(Ile2)-agmatinylcytidine synthase